MIDNRKSGGRPDLPFKAAGTGPAITRNCDQCFKPRSTLGGTTGYVRGLVKRGFICAVCVAAKKAAG